MINEQVKPLVEIRSGLKEDEPMIYSTWLPGLYYGNDWFKEIPKYEFFKNYHKCIEKVLSKTNTKVIVACLKDGVDVILSYAICESIDKGHILHWVYTKPEWRKLGLAKEVLPKEVKTVTHLTAVGRSIKPKEWIFNPFLL